ncbi:MAG: hypothetical protein LAP13_20715 [Acidobacteriia bacterium]|nr:hypothetical protein [Terriglobia bacterium]
MRRMMVRGLLLVLIGTILPLTVMSAAAQEAGTENKAETNAHNKVQELKVATTRKASDVYRVDYTIREVEGGKVLNSRKYMLMAEEDHPARTRVGNRISIQMAPSVSQYQDVGMNIDCRVREREDQLLLDTTVESSAVAAPEGSSVAISTGSPVFRRVNTTVTAAISLGKPTIVGSMDDVTSNHRYEIEVTVTQVK